MICIKANIPEYLNSIDDELKAIYHSNDSVCIWVFKSSSQRNEFVKKSKGYDKDKRTNYYEKYYK